MNEKKILESLLIDDFFMYNEFVFTGNDGNILYIYMLCEKLLSNCNVCNADFHMLYKRKDNYGLME